MRDKVELKRRDNTYTKNMYKNMYKKNMYKNDVEIRDFSRRFTISTREDLFQGNLETEDHKRSICARVKGDV